MNTTDDLLDSFYNVTATEWGAFKESLSNFRESVNWDEPFVIGLLSFHAVAFLIAILTRKKSTIQAVLFFSLLAIVYSAEYINDYMIDHWEKYTEQRYFEKSGFFISMMLSAPLLLISFIILINFLIESMGVLVEIKTKQLKQKIQKEKAAKEGKKEK